jgi:hypothetical protein
VLSPERRQWRSRKKDVPARLIGDDVSVAGRSNLAWDIGVLATRTEERAARARQHALLAREQAGRDAAVGDERSQVLHRREAVAHERAADSQERTAALYRLRAKRLRRITPNA